MKKTIYILSVLLILCAATTRADKYVGRVVCLSPAASAPRDLDPPTAARPLPPDPSAKQPEQSFLLGSLLEYLVSLFQYCVRYPSRPVYLWVSLSIWCTAYVCVYFGLSIGCSLRSRLK